MQDPVISLNLSCLLLLQEVNHAFAMGDQPLIARLDSKLVSFVKRLKLAVEVDITCTTYARRHHPIAPTHTQRLTYHLCRVSSDGPIRPSMTSMLSVR